jgi:hypothetical protein
VSKQQSNNKQPVTPQQAAETACPQLVGRARFNEAAGRWERVEVDGSAWQTRH